MRLIQGREMLQAALVPQGMIFFLTGKAVWCFQRKGLHFWIFQFWKCCKQSLGSTWHRVTPGKSRIFLLSWSTRNDLYWNKGNKRVINVNTSHKCQQSALIRIDFDLYVCFSLLYATLTNMLYVTITNIAHLWRRHLTTAGFALFISLTGSHEGSIFDVTRNWLSHLKTDTGMTTVKVAHKPIWLSGQSSRLLTSLSKVMPVSVRRMRQ